MGDVKATGALQALNGYCEYLAEQEVAQMTAIRDGKLPKPQREREVGDAKQRYSAFSQTTINDYSQCFKSGNSYLKPEETRYCNMYLMDNGKMKAEWLNECREDGEGYHFYLLSVADERLIKQCINTLPALHRTFLVEWF